MKKIIDKPYTIDIHGNIKYPPVPEPTAVEAPLEEPHTDASIDTLLMRGLSIIDRIMTSCWKDALSAVPARETVQNLKDCMSMLKDLKLQEAELLDGMTDDQIETYLEKFKK